MKDCIHIWVGVQDIRRAVLSSWLGIGEHELRFARGDRGKPFLPDFPAIHFNVSHSGRLFACAISEAVEVGIDIEQVRPVPEAESIAARYGLDAAHFFRDWTRREAYLKATGAGVFGLESPVDPSVYVEDLVVPEGYFGAWASVGKRLTAVFHNSVGGDE